jgi:hypothetical protein
LAIDRFLLGSFQSEAGAWLGGLFQELELAAT